MNEGHVGCSRGQIVSAWKGSQRSLEGHEMCVAICTYILSAESVGQMGLKSLWSGFCGTRPGMDEHALDDVEVSLLKDHGAGA